MENIILATVKVFCRHSFHWLRMKSSKSIFQVESSATLSQTEDFPWIHRLAVITSCLFAPAVGLYQRQAWVARRKRIPIFSSPWTQFTSTRNIPQHDEHFFLKFSTFTARQWDTFVFNWTQGWDDSVEYRYSQCKLSPTASNSLNSIVFSPCEFIFKRKLRHHLNTRKVQMWNERIR